MEIDLATKQQLATLLAKPASVTQAHAGMLAALVKAYPYYEPIHLLLAKAEANSGSENHYATAALYNGGNVLHAVITNPESLLSRTIKLVNGRAIMADENTTPAIADEQETFDEIVEINAPDSSNAITDEQEVFEEITEVVPLPTEEEYLPEEEIYDEINEIDLSAYPTVAATNDENTFQNATHEMPSATALPDEIAIENIVATDFFAFEKSFATEPTGDQKGSPVVVTQPEEYNQEAEAQTVSKYDDDKLPYTFLWWLAKTRKEHEQIFQPYVTPKKTAHAPQSELQQQYVEHIFHLQTPFNVADEAGKEPIGKTITHKGDDIIETFIKNEPQIRAPKADQLNNENKAKKSAEDHNDLVSETLAAIYIEQMLYHKAIETYEKLSLKFPEKSRYFADLIQSLEKKI